jgi:3-oxoadipate enol-lactonase
MDKRITVNGIELACTIIGAGPPVVLLHGWMCNRKFWDKQIIYFSKTHHILAIDFRGHGDSDTSKGGYTIEQFADDVCNVMKALGMGRAVLVGHSMGGMVAQQFCVRHTEYVSALILVTSIAADLDDRLISKRIEASTPHLGFRDAFLRYFNRWFGPGTKSDIIHWVRDQMLRTPESVGLNLVGSYRQFDLRVHLPSLSIPTLVIAAASDPSAVPVESKTLAELIPDAQLVTIEGSGHFPMLENPGTFNRMLDEFLSQHSRRLAV